MSEISSHIISKFRWNTLFDKKERGSELQERLSAWSRITMPKEVAGVFDKVCPPEQTWRIQCLEIDLGLIDYNNLEFELSTKLRAQLNEKLIDLIIYANRGGHNLEILSEDTSHIYLISSFLLNGLMPWSYKATDGSVNEMLAQELQNNRQRVIEMLRSVGVTHEDVRKRIAWQISESNIIKIIEGLEPNNHTQIIEFSNELIKIQAKETIVQASTRDLKKQLWLWILNYLITERGTVFNKVSYMKSTIRQMAAHYNIAYAELLALIERAVDIVSKNYGLKADFLQTIKAIIKEGDIHAHATNYTFTEDTTDLWETLSAYLKGDIDSVSLLNKKEVNDLIVSLANQNQLKFRESLFLIHYDKHLFINIFSNLNEASLQLILRALNETVAKLIIEGIHFLSKTSRNINLNINHKTLWHIALQFLFTNKNTAVDSKVFLGYCITELVKSTGLSKMHLLDSLTNTKLQNAGKTGLTIDTYSDLSALYISEASNNSTFISIHLADLIEELITQLIIGISDKAAFLSRQKLLLKNIRLYPKIALDVLIQYGDKDGLQKLLPYILDDYISRALINRAKVLPVFTWLQIITNEVKANSAYASLSIVIEESLLSLALKTIIVSPNLKTEATLSSIFHEFYQLISKAEAVEIRSVLIQLIQLKSIPAIEIVPEKEAHITNALTVAEQIKQLITFSNRQAEVGKILLNNFNHPQIVELRKYKSQLNSSLLNYLIPQAKALMELLIKQYTPIIANELPRVTTTEITAKLTELYWQNIAHYNLHSGHANRFKRIFKAAVLSQFDLSDQIVTTVIKAFNSDNSFLPQGKALMDLVINEYVSVLSSILLNITESEIVIRLTKLYKAALTNCNQHKGRSEELIEYFRSSVLSEFAISDERVLPQLIHFKGSAHANMLPDKQLMEALVKQYTLLITAELKTVSTNEIRLRLIDLYQEMWARETLRINITGVFATHFRKAVLSIFNIINERLSPVIIYSNQAINAVSIQPGNNFDSLIKAYATILFRIPGQLTEAEITKQLITIYQECLEKYIVFAKNKHLPVSIFKSAIERAFAVTDPNILPVTFVADFASQQGKIYKLSSGHQLTEHEILQLIEEGLTNATPVVKSSKAKIKLSELIKVAINISPAKLRAIIIYIPLSTKRLELIKESISFNQFALFIISDTSGSLSQAMEALRVLHDIVLLTASPNIASQLMDQLWQQSWKIITTNTWSAEDLNKLVKHTLYQLTQQDDVDIGSIKAVMRYNHVRINPALQDALLTCSPAFVNTQNIEFGGTPSAQLQIAENKNLLDELIYALIVQKQTPVWFNTGQDVKELLNEFIIHHPAKALLVLKQEVISEQQMQWLGQAINIDGLITAIVHLEKPKQSLLYITSQLYASLGHIVINGITAKEMQYILFRKIIKTWSTDNWRLLSTENIWNELLWDVCVKRGINKADFIRDIGKSQSYLPPSLLIAFNYLKDQHNTVKAAPTKTEITKPIKKMLEKKNNHTAIKGGVPVKNAGMVLLNNYIPMLFERLGFTAEKKFLNTNIQCDAVHYLQYVVTGLASTEESFLPLNKVLCGVPLSHPIPDGITITPAQTQLINSLIEAIIGYWNAIGSTSIDGFRGNWLVRDGLLVELDERWELTVEKRAYDLLINKSPFSFSIIKYPWMDKPLHVQWPY